MIGRIICFFFFSKYQVLVVLVSFQSSRAVLFKDERGGLERAVSHKVLISCRIAFL